VSQTPRNQITRRSRRTCLPSRVHAIPERLSRCVHTILHAASVQYSDTSHGDDRAVPQTAGAEILYEPKRLCVRLPCREGRERVWQAIELLRQRQGPDLRRYGNTLSSPLHRLGIIGIKVLGFCDHSPCNMEQFPCGRTPCDFLWLPCGAQPGVERLNHGVMLCRTQGGHIKRGP
jgi:hypothetical protein